MKLNKKTVGYLTFSALMCCLTVPGNMKVQAQNASVKNKQVITEDYRLSLNAGCNAEIYYDASKSAASVLSECNAGISLTVKEFTDVQMEEKEEKKKKKKKNEKARKEETEICMVTGEAMTAENVENVTEEAIVETPAEEEQKIPEQPAVLIADVEEILNVRSEASEESQQIGRMPNGSIAYIVEDGEEWAKITSGGIEGYVAKKYCLTDEEAISYCEANGEKKAVVEAEFLNIREEADETSEIIDIASEGENYEILSEKEKWIQISCDDEKTGYVSSAYTKTKWELPEAEPVINEEAQENEEEVSEETEETEETSASAYSEDDLELLAALIYCEAGGECYEGQLAVGAVVMNRVRSSAYPGTIREVIYQSGQFMPTWTGVLDNALNSGARCYDAAREAMSGVDNVNGALEFRMASGGHAGMVIGNQVFF